MLINKDFGNNEVNPEDLQKVDLDEDTIAQYQKVFTKQTTFWQRLGNFIKAENKAGRYAKILKDFALIFVPYGRTISSASEMATEIISDNKKRKPMLQDKKWYQSKTMWSAILLLVTATLQALGVDLMSNPELTATVYQVAMMLAGAFGLYGLRDAIGKQKQKYESK